MREPSVTSSLSMRPPRFFQALLLAAIVATFALIVLGSVVRVTGSGLGCPDWPKCHGEYIPSFDKATLLEYSHRAVASVVGLLVMGVAVAATVARPYRGDKRLLALSLLMVAMLAVAVILGRQTVLSELSPQLVTVHLAIAEAMLAVLGIIAVLTRTRAPSPATGSDVKGERFALLAIGTALATYAALVIGTLVRAEGATAACLTWPLCDGDAFPAGTLPALQMWHRWISAAVGVFIFATAIAAWRREHGAGPLRILAGLTLVFFVAQVFAGAAMVWAKFTPEWRALHLGLATAVWIHIVVLAALAWRQRHGGQPAASGAEVSFNATKGKGGARTGAFLADYLTLMKPRIIALLLVTALGGMLLAAKGFPHLTVTASVLVGGALAAGGANAINHFMDRDIDGVMLRTRSRPVPGRRVPPLHALLFGLALNGLAFLVLALGANVLSAGLALSGTLFYVFVYTGWLKRTTTQNIVIGGAAGAVPPLVGWAAVAGGLSLPAWYMFVIIFMWTPPHFWALSLLLKDDYARARIPMLPVVEGEEYTGRVILQYTVLLVAVTMLFFLTDTVGLVYLSSAAVLGGVFIYYARQLFVHKDRATARRLYKYSLLYLAALFAAIMADGSLGEGRF
ncbi:MAG: protoheme IX farnesyltransferase [Chloroflexi bacterium]|nr:protoheme IX farnesyltransferase [Chloroflexota bacterium]